MLVVTSLDFIVTDVQLMRESGEVHVDSTDIGVSDHFLVWLELGGKQSVVGSRNVLLRNGV